MKIPKQYSITPAKGQALLNFQGRRFPDKVDIFETEIIEEVKNSPIKGRFAFDNETDINSDFKNLLIHGDCLSACAYLKSQNIKVDLVYIDPPFASGANYAKKIQLRNGGKTEIEAEDNAIGEEIMYGDIWQKEDYLNWIYERLLAIRDVMSETASIYVHLDWHIGHYVKILLDEIFGEENFLNDVCWYYRRWNIEGSSFSKNHDYIFYYAKSVDKYIFNNMFIPKSSKSSAQGKAWKSVINEHGRRVSIQTEEATKGVPMPDVWDLYVNNPSVKEIISTSDNPKELIESILTNLQCEKKMRESGFSSFWDISIINPVGNARVGYATQKPEALLERIIKASSDKGMIIADFFSGSGTTAKVAKDLDRKFIACDVGINAIQTTRDRLVKAGASFDVLKIKDGLRLFRNPAQTTAKIFGIIDGFKLYTELNLNDFWDGGIANAKGTYTPVKFSGIHDKLTKELLDVYLEEIYKLEDTTNKLAEVIIIYAHKEFEIDQDYLNRQLNKVAKTELKIRLVSLDSLLGEKKDALFTPDNADIKIMKQGNKFKIEIKKFYSPYLKTKIDDYNAKKTKKGTLEQDLSKAIKISNCGLELIESVQFDTNLGKTWKSNPDLEDRAGTKDKIKGCYLLDTNKFKIKIRNIAGDEIIIDSKEIKTST